MFRAILCLLFLTACSSSSSNKESLVMLLDASPKTLDPRFATDASGMRMANLLFSSLVLVGPDLKITGDAAKSWSYKDKVFTFLTKEGLKFSDGTEVTAEDIRFSFSEYQKASNPFSGSYKNIKAVTIKSKGKAFEIQVALNEFSATFLTDLSPLKILPKKQVEKYKEDFSEHLLGSGAYVLQKKTSSEIQLKKNEHYFSIAKMPKLLFKVIQDDNTRYLKMRKGNADVAQGVIPPHRVKDFENREDFRIFTYPGLSMTYLLFNIKDKSLQNLRLRQAIAHALNRKAIIKNKFKGYAEPATSILSPSNPYFAKALPIPDYNLEKAKKLIQELGMEGKSISIKTSNSRNVVETAKIIANQLEQIGLKVELKSFEWGTFYGDIKSGNFEIASMRWIGVTDPDIYRIAFHSKELPPEGRNRGSYQNPLLDQLLEEGLKIADENQRIAHYEKIQKIVAEDLPILPLWYNSQITVIHKRVKDYSPSLNGDFSPFLTAHK